MQASAGNLGAGHPGTRRQVAGADLRRRRHRHGTTMASMGIFIHSGQGCICGSRIFAHRNVYDQVVEAVATMANSVQLGGPQDDNALIGPLISEKQLHRVMGFIDEGRRDGVEVVTGGNRLDRRGFFVHPTVLLPTLIPACVCISRRSSARWSRCCPSTTTTRSLRWPTTPSTGWRPRCEQRTSRARTGWPSGFSPAPSRSTARWSSTTRCPSAAIKQSGWGYEWGRAGIESYQTKTVYAQL